VWQKLSPDEREKIFTGLEGVREELRQEREAAAAEQAAAAASRPAARFVFDFRELVRELPAFLACGTISRQEVSLDGWQRTPGKELKKVLLRSVVDATMDEGITLASQLGGAWDEWVLGAKGRTERTATTLGFMDSCWDFDGLLAGKDVTESCQDSFLSLWRRFADDLYHTRWPEVGRCSPEWDPLTQRWPDEPKLAAQYMCFMKSVRKFFAEAAPCSVSRRACIKVVGYRVCLLLKDSGSLLRVNHLKGSRILARAKIVKGKRRLVCYVTKDMRANQLERVAKLRQAGPAFRRRLCNPKRMSSRAAASVAVLCVLSHPKAQKLL
jgi:hypothetical protein